MLAPMGNRSAVTETVYAPISMATTTRLEYEWSLLSSLDR